jgi:hypothetical protein
MSFGCNPYVTFTVRRLDYSKHRFKETHAHQLMTYITTEELGPLISNIKHAQGASEPFMRWWKVMVSFYYGGRGDPVRLPIAFLIQAIHTKHAWAVLQAVHTRGCRSIQEHLHRWRVQVIQRMGGVPEEVYNPALAGNPHDTQHAAIPYNHPGWAQPNPPPHHVTLPEPQGSLGSDEDDLKKFLIQIQDLWPHQWPRLAQVKHFLTGEDPPLPPGSGGQDAPAPHINPMNKDMQAALAIATDLSSG